MNLYCVIYTIADDATYPERREDLVQALRSFVSTGHVWADMPTVWMFESDADLDAVAVKLKSALNMNRDALLLMRLDAHEGRAIGQIDVDYLQRASPEISAA